MPRPRATILRKVRVPNSLPYFFTALKLASTLSLIGAIVAEYFGGLGVRARPDDRPERERPASSTSRGPPSSLAAVAGHRRSTCVIALVERLVIPWHSSSRNDG